MLTAIRIGPSKALPPTSLYGLGKINVFCGKNNSGKSTVLETICSDKRRDGVSITGETLDALVRDLANAYQTPVLHRADFRPMIQSVASIAHDSTWFSDDLERLMTELTTPTNHLFGGQWNPARARAILNALFQPGPTAVRLPENRFIETTSQVYVTGARQDPASRGLLNVLFIAKNARLGSSDRELYEELEQRFFDLSDGYVFDITLGYGTVGEQPSHQLVFSRDERHWYPAEACGYGLQQLLYLIYFALERFYPIICIEEPETHLHARMQYGLALLFRSVPDKQFFISTHSNIFLRQTITDRVFVLRMDDHIHVEDATSRAAILTDLGYDIADNLVSDVLVLLEGPTDVPVLEVFLRKRGILPKYRVSFWPIGGDNMARLDLTPVVERANVLALVDNDPGSEKARRRFMEECERVGVEVTRLQGRAIENYFTIPALRGVFGGQIPPGLSVLDISLPVKDQIGLDPKAKNWNVASEMSIDDIAGTDLAVFLDKVASRAARQDE
jgi:hypothetical protein